MLFFTQILKFVFSLPKTILFNFKVFPFNEALKLPILVAYNVKVANAYKNCIKINSKLSRFMIKINWTHGSDGINHSLTKSGYFDVRNNGKIIFNGRANFSSGISIRVEEGMLTFGDNFSCNRHCLFSCSNNISIGNDVLLGWGVSIRDSDGHSIYNLDKPNVVTNEPRPVIIGNHTWLAANVDILKGVIIPDECVVGYNSCVSKKFKENNCIIAGYPAEIVKTNITWKK